MVATYGGNYSSGNISEPVNFGTNVKDRQISVQVSVPLIDGGALQAHVAEARAKRAKAQADFMAAQRQAALSSRQGRGAANRSRSRPQCGQRQSGGIRLGDPNQQ
jgi:outer membrane protein TolC